MDKLLGKMLEVLNVSARVALGGAIITGLLLFGPTSIISALGMTTIVTEWLPWIGSALLAFSVVLLVRILASVGLWTQKRWTWWTSARDLRGRLRSLAADEKTVLARFLLERRKCLSFPMDDGVSQGLEAAGILFRSSKIGSALDGFDFSMQPWAWEFLNNNPHLVISDPEEIDLLFKQTMAADVAGIKVGRLDRQHAPERRRLW